ncbi:hypothetical protein [Arenibacter palladensis]|uniref:hypothetical protein n=1 Tax=Arenibacter palladensis TaxID=237373 RepID=UPI0026E32E5B|nr:hypothetical protein [Arenibacter palladensis]MDO6601665.1 hypothetical protein [Arenibacter palladensis]
MMEDELIKIWQSSPNQERIKFEKSKLMIDVQSSLDRFHRTIKYRDLMETIPGIIIIPIFVYIAYTIPFTLSKIGAIWIILSIIYIIIRLQKAKKIRPGSFTETYRDYLIKTKEYLFIQKKLLDTVIYWYFSPIAIGIVLFSIGAINNIKDLLVNLGGLIVSGIIVYILNKRAIKKQITPRLKKIDELLKVMEE